QWAFAGALAFSLLTVQSVTGQGQGPGGAPGGATPPGGGTTTPGGTPGSPGVGSPGRPPSQQPGQFPGDQNRNQFPDLSSRPIFLSGKVVTDDGTPPPDQVVIERVCNGQPRPEGYTDSKGRFSFQLGQNSAMMMDASTPSGDGLGGGGFGQPRGIGSP